MSAMKQEEECWLLRVMKNLFVDLLEHWNGMRSGLVKYLRWELELVKVIEYKKVDYEMS